MLIYLVRNKIDGKIYVGQTSGSLSARWRFHVKDAKRGCNTYLHKAIRKYGADAFTTEEICRCRTKADLNRMEIFYIAEHKAYPPSLGFGYNMTSGGEGFHGKKDTPAWNKGKKLSEETRRKMSISRTGNQNRLGTTQSAETRAKIASVGKGRKLSEEFSRKLSERNRSRPNPRLGMKTPEVTKLKQSEARRKAWAAKSPEERHQMSRGARRPKTEEHRRKLSEATLAYYLSKRAAKNRPVI